MRKLTNPGSSGMMAITTACVCFVVIVLHLLLYYAVSATTRPNWREERKLNVETFGARSASQYGRRGGYYRGGRGRGGRGYRGVPNRGMKLTCPR